MAIVEITVAFCNTGLKSFFIRTSNPQACATAKAKAARGKPGVLRSLLYTGL